MKHTNDWFLVIIKKGKAVGTITLFHLKPDVVKQCMSGVESLRSQWCSLSLVTDRYAQFTVRQKHEPVQWTLSFSSCTTHWLSCAWHTFYRMIHRLYSASILISDCILLVLTSSYLHPFIIIFLILLQPPFIFHHLPLLSPLSHPLLLLHPPGIIYQHKCWLSSCWCYCVFFFITLTRGTDTIDSPTGPGRSYMAFERIGKQMDFRGSILAAAHSLNNNS